MDSKSIDFASIAADARQICASGGSPGDRLQKLCGYLNSKVSHYDWFGFYIAERNQKELFLGPFAGEPTEHTRIPFGRGICGQAAESKETFLVDDVSAASNYLACSLKVKSEIVVPVFAPGSREVAGEIDIDSHQVAAFTSGDRAFLESLAGIVAADVEALRA